jgi:flagellar hook-length control protein FliK
VELRVELPRMEFAREGFAESGSSPASSAGEAAAGNFESLLSGELRGALGQDILRQATLILRDGGEGLIRLALKPESLGTVKIRLEMAENKVSGRIIVESDEVLRAFERELQTLEQAFKDSGFDGASIEMAISSGGGGDPRERQEPEAEGSFQGRRLLRLAAADYDSTAVQAPEDLFDEAGIFGSSRRPVNMLV